MNIIVTCIYSSILLSSSISTMLSAWLYRPIFIVHNRLPVLIGRILYIIRVLIANCSSWLVLSEPRGNVVESALLSHLSLVCTAEILHTLSRHCCCVFHGVGVGVGVGSLSGKGLNWGEV